MARRKARQTVAESMDLRHYSLVFARAQVIPAASADVDVMLDALEDGELSAVWLDHRVPGDLDTPLPCIPFSDAGYEGVAVLGSQDDAGRFAADAFRHGLPRAIQRWVGYADFTQSGDMLISVRRGDGAVHEEIITDGFAARRKAELARVFTGDRIVVSSVVEGYLARAGRYSDQDRTRFLYELQRLQQMCDTTCLSLAGANLHVGRVEY